MVTEPNRRKKKRLSNNEIVFYRIMTMCVLLFVSGFLFGRLTKPAQIETILKTEYVPVAKNYFYYSEGTPDDIEKIQPTSVEHYSLPISDELQDYIFELCNEENVPVSLVLSMISTESQFEPTAISSTGDWGLMQINECNHSWLEKKYDVSDFLDPYENVYCGIKIIGQLLDKYEDYHLALMAYNMGEKGAKELWDKGITSSSYSREIVANMKQFEEGENGSDITN
jgi:soluble lytic murein transglycosylase-like protein